MKLIRTQTGLSDEEISPELVLAKQIALVARRLILNSGYYKSKDPQHIKEYHKKYMQFLLAKGALKLDEKILKKNNDILNGGRFLIKYLKFKF